ncbi:MAG: alpha/beta hydrolase [Eubacteriales bacterium]|nr:alpha/beta hydrolase [Eubacteriales bacterium]
MRQYSKELAELLKKPGHVISVNDVDVEIKEVPDGNGTHGLDPRTLCMELEKQKNDNGPQDFDLEKERECMGGFNYNLNEKTEVYTKYLEVQTTVGVVPVWMYYPRHICTDRPALLYVHGGAFLGGSPFTLENQCRLIVERGDCVVLNIDYSLAPEHPYPIPCTQIYEVLCYVYEHAQDLRVDKNKLAIAGDSAGGNLAAVCALMDRDKGTHYLKAQALLYAKLTFTNHNLPEYTRDETVFEICEEQRDLLPGMLCIGSDRANAGDEKIYVQGRYDISDPYISPAFGNKTGLPETLILLAEYDGLRLEGEFYAMQLRRAQVPVKVIRYNGVCHGFFDRLGILPQAEDAVNEIVKMIVKIERIPG